MMENKNLIWSKPTEQIRHFKDCLNWKHQFVTHIFIWNLLEIFAVLQKDIRD